MKKLLLVLAALALAGCSKDNPLNRTPEPEYECNACAGGGYCPQSCTP